MGDARHFLRHVLPGSAVALETLLFLYLIKPTLLARAVDLVLRGGKTLEVIVSLLLGSGAVGYLISVLYHSMGMGVDHRQMLRAAVQRGYLRLDGMAPERPSRAQAWDIATAIWQSRIGRSKRLQGANLRTDSLTSILHAAGSFMVGTVAAFIGAVLVCTYSQYPFYQSGCLRQFISALGEITIGNPVRFTVSVAVFALLILLQYVAFRAARNHS